MTGSTSFASSQNYLTDVGAYPLADSPYGTFDQGGNVWEWNDVLISGGLHRVQRGGSFDSDSNDLHVFDRVVDLPSNEFSSVGFRVANIPEPSTPCLGALGIVVVLWCRRCKS